MVGCKPGVMSSPPNTETTIHTRGGVWLGVSPLSCRPHQIPRLPFLLEEECVVG